MDLERDWNCADIELRASYAEATRDALRVLEGKWKISILCELFAARAPVRFSGLERQVKGVNQKMLVQQLKELQKDGIVQRTVFPQVPPRVEYELTELGRALGPAMAAMIDWAQRRRDADAARTVNETRTAPARPPSGEPGS